MLYEVITFYRYFMVPFSDNCLWRRYLFYRDLAAFRSGNGSFLVNSVCLFNLEEFDKVKQLRRLRCEFLRHGGRFFRGRSILLNNLVQLNHRFVNLNNT